MREALHSKALRSGGVSELVTLDSDGESLEQARQAHPELPLRTVCGSVAELFKLRRALGQFDFAYSLGLFDYLPQKVAARTVTKSSTSCVPTERAPGGQLRSGARGHRLHGSVHGLAFIFRNEQDMLALCGPELAPYARAYRDPSRCIVLLEITKPR